jgi:regulator of nucleoside diphosphate kinase
MNIQGRERVLTELDHVRLATLSRRGSRDRWPRSQGIDAVLDGALVVPSRAVDSDIVTMYSKVRLRLDDGTERELTLCYPHDAEPQFGSVSVLSPIGLSLLGQQVGAPVRWQSPDGTVRTAQVADIVFQPEASRDYTT